MSIEVIHMGVGVRGRHWLEFVSQHPDFDSVACVDKNEKALNEVRSIPSQLELKYFTDLKEALVQVKADAVIIASPSFLHAEHIVQVIDSGLAVFVEKPLACDLQEAVTVVECARKSGSPVVVAENFRFFQAERTVRNLLDKGLIGRLSAAVCVDLRDQPSHTQGPWVQNMKNPFLHEIAVHHFDSFRYLFNRNPLSIITKTYNPHGSDYLQHAAAEAVIELDDGFVISYSGTFVANRYEYRLLIEGEKGDIWTDRKRVWLRPKKRRFFRPVKLIKVPKGDELRYPKAGTVSLLNQFRDMLLTDKIAETSGENNLWTIAMVEASILSVCEKRNVQIDEVFTSNMKSQAGFNE